VALIPGNAGVSPALALAAAVRLPGGLSRTPVEEKGADETIALPAIDESFCGSQENLVGDVVKVFLLIIRQARDPSPGPATQDHPWERVEFSDFLPSPLGERTAIPQSRESRVRGYASLRITARCEAEPR